MYTEIRFSDENEYKYFISHEADHWWYLSSHMKRDEESRSIILTDPGYLDKLLNVHKDNYKCLFSYREIGSDGRLQFIAFKSMTLLEGVKDEKVEKVEKLVEETKKSEEKIPTQLSKKKVKKIKKELDDNDELDPYIAVPIGTHTEPARRLYNQRYYSELEAWKTAELGKLCSTPNCMSSQAGCKYSEVLREHIEKEYKSRRTDIAIKLFKDSMMGTLDEEAKGKEKEWKAEENALRVQYLQTVCSKVAQQFDVTVTPDLQSLVYNTIGMGVEIK